MSESSSKRGPYKKRRINVSDGLEDADLSSAIIQDPGIVSVCNDVDVHATSCKEDIAVVVQDDIVVFDKTCLVPGTSTSHLKQCDFNHDEMNEDLDRSSSSSENELPIYINQRNVIFEYNQQDEDNNDDNTVFPELIENMKLPGDIEYADEEEIATVFSNPILEVIDDEIPEVLKKQSQNKDSNIEAETPLYKDCSKSLGLILLMICALSIRFKLSDEALSFIITIINMIIPTENNMIKSIYSLKEYLKKFVSFPTVHYLCSLCGTHIQKDQKICSNKHCKQDLSQSGAVGYFIQHSIISQLQLMSKRSSFLQKIRAHRFQHYAKNMDNTLNDVYDGSNYKKVYENGFLRDPNSVSFSLNTDGVQIFKSSSISMWPVYMIINELPPSERKLKENIVYYGLWIASKKPFMWSYLKPLHEELCKLEDGVQMQDNKGEEFCMRATLLNCVCDLPARCLVSNSMQFNGKFGCWFCLQSGETYTTNKGGHVHIFPYQDCDPKGPERTAKNLQSVNEVVEKIQANDKNFIVHGVKGPFWFMFLKHFNVIHGFVIDYMHGICAGLMKLLLNLWFDKQNKTEKFSIFSMKTTVNSRLSSINPTLDITRPPRSLDDLSHWKSAEFRNFLFMWSLPVLYDILPKEYYLHFSLLVRGIYTLSREKVTKNELKNAENCLLKFVENFHLFYTNRYLTMNCHQLLHITDCVRANGPLFANNCFVFEDLNGYILKHIHGTTGIEMQLINAITKMQALPTLKEIHVKEGSMDEALLNRITRPNYISDGECIENGIFNLGQTFRKTLDEAEYSAVSDFLSTCSPVLEVTEFRKIFNTKMSSAVYGTSYDRLQKRNQSIVKFKDIVDCVQFGSVKTFIQIKNHKNEISNLALVHPFIRLSPYSNQQSCHRVNTQFSSIIAVPLHNLLKVCSLLKIENICFIVEFPNKYEKD